ncbi:carbohydrate ABC transporter permease [Pseudarthrobacter sp. NBSH8]|uniref:carbohydrate ABC transporter permease n=1 Tax=Pseudarthrobacter sp. NBSH8 TaxID=2596911 RepID=UPI001C641C47|nr:sugar ABC transporter permease [Pseudarthrobacter sp. NBSH8]
MRDTTLAEPSRPQGREGARSRTAGKTMMTVSSRRKRNEALTAYLFLLPLFIGAIIFNFYPIVRSLYLSLTETGFFSGETFVGLEQYTKLLQDPEMWRALGNTLTYAVVGLLGIPIAVMIAGLLNRKGLRFVSGYRIIYFIPVVTMPVAVGLVWKFLFSTEYGLVNQALSTVGIPPIAWLTDPNTVMITIALVGIWASLGQNIVLMIAGLQTVPSDLLEAAALDGAGSIRRFFRISVPIASPTIFLVSVLTVIGSLQVFDLVFVMIGPTSPNVRNAETIVYYFYQTAIVEQNRGYGAAIVCVLLVLTLLLTLAQFRLQKKWVHYE